MAFLAPALLAGLAAVAIPILLHLVQRERKRMVEFPSLMFLRKIPYQSVRRRAVRNWALLALRAAVVALLAVAFARPFVRDAGARSAAGGSGREVVVLLDRSASMGYGDNWRRAREAARGAVRALGAGDRGTIAFFSTDVEMGPRSTTEHGALLSAIDRTAPGAGATRYGPALRAAAGVLETSSIPRREIVLVSDFQKNGWDASDDLAVPAGVEVRTVSVAADAPEDLALAGLTIERQADGEREQVRAAARVVNRGAAAVEGREVALEVDGRRVDVRAVSVEPGAAAVVSFSAFALPPGGARVTARLAHDALEADNVFHAFLPAAERIPVLIVESASPQPDSDLYLSRALEVGRAPAFQVTSARADRLAASEMRSAKVIVLNDAPVSAQAARAIEANVSGGAGLLVALGERSEWPADAPNLLPGVFGVAVDRSGTRGGTLGYTDLGHPAFEIFSSPRSGDLTAARVFRYRRFTATLEAEGSRVSDVIARFDDGAVALAETALGQGRVMVWTSTFDSYWNDFALKPVFVPFLHQVMKYLAGYVEPKPWYIAGETFESARSRVPGVDARTAAAATFVTVSPAGRQETIEAGERPLAIPLREQGFYEIRVAGKGAATGGGPASALAAVNVDPAESDLTPIDPEELAGAVRSGAASEAKASEKELTLEERERRQSLWQYVFGAVLLLLVAEIVVANRLPRTA
ncbi:MAG: BatA domain-containing protein [Vicinamibacterales bacterium]